MKEQISTLTGGTYTQPFLLAGKFNLSIRGTWDGTLSLQRSFDNGASWGTVQTYTQNIEDVGDDPEGCLYRLGFTTYTSGTAWLRLGQ